MKKSAKEERAGIGIVASYGSGKFLAEFLTGGFAALVFKFYETEIGMPAGLVALAIVLYSIWNAVNDPLIGFFTGRPTRLTARYGRRYPWIVAGSLSCAFAFFFIFAPAAGMKTPALFAWLLVSICLYDALYSTWELNYQSVFPDRFRNARERSRAAGVGTLIGVFGIAAGAVLPTFIIRYGQPATYRSSALVFCAIALLVSLLLRPGTRETPGMISRYLEQEKRRTEAPSFFRQLARALKTRNFLAFILLYFFYQSATLSMTASIHYVGDYLLDGKSTTLIFAGMLVGALVAVPLWTFLARLIKSSQATLAASAAALGFLSLPLMFVAGYWGFVAAMFAWGLAFGGFWLMMTPALADVVDEMVLSAGMREDGVYLGFRAFAGRLAYAVQAISFWLVHLATGFQADHRSASAKFGIRLHTALIPAILLFVGVGVFIMLNTLDGARVEKNRRELAARKL
jgi:GPH family glycoside/pentoside/hexuronide:cation symporter